MKIYKKLLIIIIVPLSLSAFCPPCECIDSTSPLLTSKVLAEQISLLKTKITNTLNKTIQDTKKLKKEEEKKYQNILLLEAIEKTKLYELMRINKNLTKYKLKLVLQIKKELNQNKNLSLENKQILVKILQTLNR